MTHCQKAYPGRLIFDHLPKTAGQAINAWLVSELGTGCVTPNTVGDHSELIRKYGGLYSVISAHVRFDDENGLGPRYQYITLFRDPVDRVVSCLFFVIKNHDDLQLPVLRKQVFNFLDGQEEPLLSRFLNNAYVEHFFRIEGDGTESDNRKIENSLSAIKKYEVVGLYDEIPRFLSEVAALIGLPDPRNLRDVNVTKHRPRMNELSPALLERITSMNRLDIRLFDEVVAWKKASKLSGSMATTPSINSRWVKRKKARMQAQAPREAGTYTLMLTLIQEIVGWFEDKGFEASRHTIKVEAAHA